MVRRKRPKLNSDIPFSWHPFHWKWTLILCFIPRGPEYFFKLTIYASEQICTHRLFSKLWVKLINGFFFLLNVAHTSKTHVHLRNKVKEKARSLHRYEQGSNCLLVLMGQLRDQSKYKAKIHLWLSPPAPFSFFFHEMQKSNSVLSLLDTCCLDPSSSGDGDSCNECHQ